MTTATARRPTTVGGLAIVTGAIAAGAVGYAISSLAAGAGGALSAVAVLMAAAVVVAIAVRPELGAMALPVLVFANAGLVLNQNYGIPNIITGAALLVAVVFVVRSGGRQALLRTTPILVAYVGFALVRVVSALQAADGADPVQVTRDLLIGLVIVMAVTAVASREDRLRHSLELVVATAALLAAATILKQMGIGGTWFGFATDNPLTAEQIRLQYRAGFQLEGDAARATGPVADANFWAQSLVLALPLALWSMRRGPTRLTQICAAVAAALIVTGVALTQSRGGAIALALGIAVWLWLQGGRYRFGILLLPVIIALAVVFSGSADRFEQLRNIDDPSQTAEFRGRLSENIAALQMWRDHPVLGVGSNEFPSNYREYAREIGLDARAERNAHNSYLQIAAESGTAGLAAFLALVATGLWAGLRARTDLMRRGLVSAAGGAEALVAGFVGYLAAAVLLHQAFPQYLWVWLGFLGGALLLSGYRARPMLGQAAR